MYLLPAWIRYRHAAVASCLSCSKLSSRAYVRLELHMHLSLTESHKQQDDSDAATITLGK